MKASTSNPPSMSLSMDFYGDHQRIARIFNQFIFVIILGFGAGIIFEFSRNNILAASALGICIVPVLLSLYFVRQKQFETTAAILAVVLLSLITFVSTFGEGIHQVSVLAYPAVLIVASLVIRKRVMVFLTLYNIGCVAWLIFGNLSGLFTIGTVSTTPGEFVIIAIILGSTAYMVRLLTESLFQNNLRLQSELQERKQAENALRTSEALYRKAIEVANAVPYHQTYHVHGRSVDYDFIGDGIRQITGYGPEEFTEDHWDSLTQERVLLDELAQYSFNEATQKVRSGVHPVWKCNHRIRAKDGSTHWVFEAAVELRDQNGISHGSIGMFQDITERKRVEDEREKLIAELERRNAELERFTYTVSHDLKSPLVTINGFMGYLEADAASGNMERFKLDRQRIQGAVDKMRALLDDLLELSRIGRLMNQPENIPFDEMVREAREMVHGQIEARNVTVLTQPGLPIVHGDRQRLIEILQNLIDNAIKYMGDQTNPIIEIGQSGEEDGKLVFFIRDNGIGIAPEYHERIFGLFNKLDSKSEGTGVGLALVKRIVEFHGGRIWVEGEVGNGSTFYFTLPRG